MNSKAERSRLSETGATIVENRLLAVYKLAGQEIRERRNGKKSEIHLDIGTYNGFALETIGSFAKSIISFDLDFPRLQNHALKNPWIERHYPQRVSLMNMKAQDIGLKDESVDSITCIEVFGAGFEGSKEEIDQVFREMNRVLKPGGTAVFTVKSETMDRILSSITGFGSEKGYPVNHRSIHDILNSSFQQIDWYGQMFVSYSPNENSSHINFPTRLIHRHGLIYPEVDSSAFMPVAVDMKFSKQNAEDFLNGKVAWPRYWVGVAQKRI